MNDDAIAERLKQTEEKIRQLEHELDETNKGVVALNLELEQRVDEKERAKAALRDVNRELEAFSYSVSHDLRAPLRWIDGFSQALAEDYTDKLDEQGRDYLSRIRQAVERMDVLIDDLLKLSRVSRHELRFVPVDISVIVASIAEGLKKNMPDREVDFRIAPAVGARCDPSLLRIALENLMGNAWKFTSKLKSACIEFGSCNNEGATVFFIRDNGAGFDMKFADRLFKVFQRLHDQSEFEGTGIGLALVQRIIRRHSGRIWAEGEPDAGACFYFTLEEAGVQAAAEGECT